MKGEEEEESEIFLKRGDFEEISSSGSGLSLVSEESLVSYLKPVFSLLSKNVTIFSWFLDLATTNRSWSVVFGNNEANLFFLKNNFTISVCPSLTAKYNADSPLLLIFFFFKKKGKKINFD